MDIQIKDLLTKYISDQCTAEELSQVTAILKSGLYEQEWLAVMEEEAAKDLSANYEIPHFDFNSNRVLERINESTQPRVKSYAYKWAIGIAAALLISVAAGYLAHWLNYTPKQEHFMASQATQAGERKVITLTDGSKVTLNNRSELRYASDFDGNKREVWLKGEAFFDIKRDTKRPFIVHTEQLNVRVLGTSFNVRSYQNDKQTSVGVVTGKVGVNKANADKTYMLLPGNLLSYHKTSDAFNQQTLSTDEILGWQNGLLVFHQEAIEEIVPELERWYNVSVQVNRKHLLKKRITASFSRKSLPAVMEILSKTGGFTYVIDQDKVQIN